MPGRSYSVCRANRLPARLRSWRDRYSASKPAASTAKPRPAATSCVSSSGKPKVSYRRKARSEEHTSELHSPTNLVCRLLLEKKKKGIKVKDVESLERGESGVRRGVLRR